MLANKTILQMKYARVVRIFADAHALPYADALGFFYSSYLYRLMSEGVADMHCRSDEYLADVLADEWQEAPRAGGQ